MKSVATTISAYNKLQKGGIGEICVLLEKTINANLKKSGSKIWHGTPVWFLDENPIVSYMMRKGGYVSLMFFSGQSFDEPALKAEGKFKAAEIFYKDKKEITLKDLKRWLKKAKEIQWDYKNIIKRKRVLKRVK